MAQVTVERAERVGERDSDGDSGEINSDSEGEGKSPERRSSEDIGNAQKLARNLMYTKL